MEELQRFILKRDSVSCQGGICLHTLQDLVKYSHFLGIKMPLLPQLTRPWIPGPGLLHTEIKTKVSLWAGMWNSNACLCTRKHHLISLISKFLKIYTNYQLSIYFPSVLTIFCFIISYKTSNSFFIDTNHSVLSVMHIFFLCRISLLIKD